MKKRILAMLLSGLLLLSATACQNATGNEIDTIQNNQDEIEESADGVTDASEVEKNDENWPEQNANQNISDSGTDSGELTTSPTESYWPIRSSYKGDSAYIQEQTDIYFHKKDGKGYFYMLDWRQEFPAVEDFVYLEHRVCGSVGETTAWIFEYERPQTDEAHEETMFLTMHKIHRDTGDREKSILSFPYKIFHSVFCNMIDDNTGYLFIYAHQNANIIELAYLAKTTDGGEHWILIECNEDRPTNDQKDCITVSHFFDENHGIIAVRTSAGANANRIYVTSDSGRTWNIARLPYDDYDPEFITADDRYVELVQFKYYKGMYVLVFSLRGWGIEREELLLFASEDLESWTYLA